MADAKAANADKRLILALQPVAKSFNIFGYQVPAHPGFFCMCQHFVRDIYPVNNCISGLCEFLPHQTCATVNIDDWQINIGKFVCKVLDRDLIRAIAIGFLSAFCYSYRPSHHNAPRGQSPHPVSPLVRACIWVLSTL
jgi:hypothetical protein